VDEVAWLLRPRREGWVIDGTVGMGGHADPEARARAGTRLARFGGRVTLAQANFRETARVAAEHGVREAQSALLDLGVSSYQLDESGRGFSFQRDEPLDMRLDPTRGATAGELLNRLDEPALARILHEYGEERYARRIARTIVRRRPLRTTGELVAAVRAAVPRAAWPARTHVATRTFQALRMAVNDETGALRQSLQEIPGLLAVGGRLGVISFHSGEDRIVKQTFRALAAASYAALEPSPLTPGDDEVRANPRARSAKLRVLERIA
jgi:16S rRNA (cytosine1402-N4)-methyltransferase